MAVMPDLIFSAILEGEPRIGPGKFAVDSPGDNR